MKELLVKSLGLEVIWLVENQKNMEESNYKRSVRIGMSEKCWLKTVILRK